MIERLALPSWNAPPVDLEGWTAKLAELGHPATVSHEGGDETWIEIGTLRLKGFVVIENGQVEAINFELHNADPSLALDLIERAATSLAWELHEDNGEDDG